MPQDTNNEFFRSPLFYMGDKFKLLGQLKKSFPADIDRFIEPFCGGGSVFLNVKANKYLLNDIDSSMIQLHRFLTASAGNRDAFWCTIKQQIESYGLSASFMERGVPDALKAAYPKTYFSKYNKAAYLKLRADYNQDKGDMLRLYLLIIYGFNRILRFNASGDFNVPVGNVDFNENVVSALNAYFDAVQARDLTFYSMDFEAFLDKVQPTPRDFVYLDPPYLISLSEYNKLWNEKEEQRLLGVLDTLAQKNIRFAISNVIQHKDSYNRIFQDWARRYHTRTVYSNYISFRDNTNKGSHEVLVTNYEVAATGRQKQYKPLSFSTTMRNPGRIPDFLDAIAPFEGHVLTNELIAQITRTIIRRKLYQPNYIRQTPRLKQILDNDDTFSDADIDEILQNSPQKHKEAGFDAGWPSRFDTWYHLSMELGFIYYEMYAPIVISTTGHMAIDAMHESAPNQQKLQNVFLNALMKYQTSNPFRKNANDTAPLPLLLQVIKLLKDDPEENGAGLYKSELSFLICWPNQDANAIYRKIKDFRAKYGFTYGSEVIYEQCLALLGATMEQKNRFKMNQITGEAVDDFIRKMRITGVVSLKGNGRFLDFNTLEMPKINYILKHYTRYDKYKTRTAYFRYLGSIDSQILEACPHDAEAVLQRRAQTLSKWAATYSKAEILKELRLVCRNSESKNEVLRFIDKPTRLEFLVSIALMQQFPDAQITANYHVDDEGLPTFTAPGGKADIECFDGDSRVLVEVTQMRARNQAVSEMPAITRHLVEAAKRAPHIRSFSLLVAPLIHADTRYMAGFSKYQYQVDIYTLTVDEFIKALSQAKALSDLSTVL